MRDRTNKKKKTNAPVSHSMVNSAASSLFRHQQTPIFTAVRSVSQIPGDSVLHGDPFLPAAKVQYIHKSDFCTETYVLGQCTPSKSYSAGKSDHVHRLLWCPPVIVKQADSGNTIGKTQGDQRGVFADIGVAKLTFKNVMKQPVKIIINSPRGRIADPSTCYLRRFKREIMIAPGKVRAFTASWGDKANIFTPLSLVVETTSSAPYQRLQAFAVADYTIVVPDVDEMSGKSITDLAEQSAVQVRVQQRYIATASYTGVGSSIEYVSRIPLLVAKLGKLSDMMYESPINLMGSFPNDVVVKQVAGRITLFQGGNPLDMSDYEGRMLVMHGVVGYWKIVDSNLVYWDHVSNSAHDVLIEPIVVAPGCPWQILPAYDAVSLKEIISFLTTVTEILSVVAAFI